MELLKTLHLETSQFFSNCIRPSSVACIALYSFGGITILLFTVYLWLWPFQYATLHFRNLPGPPSDSWFWGVIPTLIKSPPSVPHSMWTDEYGPTIRYRVALGAQRFLTIDPTALNYILSHIDLFPKPSRVRKALSDLLGNGLLTTEGYTHKRQRKALNPSFSPAAIRGMVPIFYDKAYELKTKLLGIISDDETEQASPTPCIKEDEVEGGKKIDVMKYLGKTTLDVIGIVGFSYDFKALSEPHNELSEAYSKMFQASMDANFWDFLRGAIPLVNKLPNKRATEIAARKAVTLRIGKKIVEDKKREVMSAHSEGLEKREDIGDDLLSILIKANMASDVKPEQKLSDEEVLDQITTFMLAGNETSSTALTWILYSLTQHPECQKRLREEVLAVADDRPSLETLNSLPYMDAVIRETLRLNAPAPGTLREAKQDAVIPLSMPVIGRDGKQINSVRINKGTVVFIPILTVNTSPAIWGPDARIFNPNRHLKTSSNSFGGANMHVPGVWGNMLSFLGGARNCIGYKLALAEISTILFVLMRSFEFQELKSKPEVEKKASVVMRPRIKGEESAGLQMPLMVKPL
ncbi:cytochrome P450 [Cryptococcus bacillisporus CA1873]|uniref:Cytochrome P450 n=1 Tax=Cryptococcus bacillisporus CA1873 TaxID=1296111 RepID=A0ABR5BCF7_CRYGA|nr:cytochrome P450 [Cryptococcus bacillisporus CA1873]|eukprot:KIR63999.1 cytochrome P450 [Cryptococcus gattii CA1873]